MLDLENYTENDSRNFAIWTDKQKFEFLNYYLDAKKIIEKSRNDNTTKQEIINQFDELQIKFNELSENGSKRFFNDNLAKLIKK